MGIRDRIRQLRTYPGTAEGRDRVAAAAQIAVAGGALALHIGGSVLRDLWLIDRDEQDQARWDEPLPDEDLVTPEHELHPEHDQAMADAERRGYEESMARMRAGGAAGE